MDLEAMRLFAIVAQEGSLQGAARSGSASRTTLRRKLDDLEESVGVPLMMRGSTGVELTEAGEMLARRTQELMHQFSMLIDTAREIGLNPPRPIRVIQPVGMPPKGMSMVLQIFRQMWPDLQLIVHEEPAAGRGGCRDFDLCLSLLRNIPDGPYEVLKLVEVDLVLLGSPEYLEKSRPIRTVDDLKYHPIFAWDDPETGVPDMLPTKDGEDVPFKPVSATNNPHTLHELVAAGDGLALTLHREADDEDAARFRPILPDKIGAKRWIHLLVSNASAESPRIKTIADATRQFANM